MNSDKARIIEPLSLDYLVSQRQLKAMSVNLRVISGSDFEFWYSGGTPLFTFGSGIVRLSQADMDWFSIDVMHSLGSGLKAKLK